MRGGQCQPAQQKSNIKIIFTSHGFPLDRTILVEFWINIQYERLSPYPEKDLDESIKMHAKNAFAATLWSIVYAKSNYFTEERKKYLFCTKKKWPK